MKIRFRNSVLLVSFLAIVFSCDSGGSKKRTDVVLETGDYQEKFRPQFHFSPEKGWMNDPNGLVYYEGEYHMFYQYYPDSTVWGPMHWGHAVSRDLVHWTHLPIALYPDSLGYIFSGSAVVDVNNTSGFGKDDIPPIIAVFTYHNSLLERSGSCSYESQGIAYSIDNGRTWIKYSGNPVLPSPGKKDFRDPKVFWHEETGKWIMILAVHDRVYIYSSPDLKSWSFESEFGEKAGAHGGVWECPDLFPLRVEGSDEKHWTMLVNINPGGPNGGSATQYFTGSFDGHEFQADSSEEKWMDWGTDNYAGVTWSGIPDSDGRRILIGWMSNWNYATVVPTSVWRSAMTIPRELSIKRDNGDYILISKPVSELDTLRQESKSVLLSSDNNRATTELLLTGENLNQCELKLEFGLNAGFNDTVGIILENNFGEKFIVGYSVPEKLIFADRTKAGDASFSETFAGVIKAPYEAGNKLSMQLLIDVSSAELFVDDGKLVMTNIFFPAGNYSKLKVFPGKKIVLPEKAEIIYLNRIWH